MATTKPRKATAAPTPAVGLPRWVLVVGAVAALAPAPSVSVSGSGNVVVGGPMSGGTIHNGGSTSGGGTKP